MTWTGILTIKEKSRFYSLYFPNNGWLAADLVQYLDDILRRQDREIGILKLLGYTMEVRTESPPRQADHWVEVDLEGPVLTTNSSLIRKAVHRIPPDPEDPLDPHSLDRIYRILDAHDFTVKLIG